MHELSAAVVSLTERHAQAACRIVTHPLHVACELEVLASAEGRSEIRFAVNAFTGNVIGTLHGGILYAMADVAAFMALLSVIPDGLHGVTADIQVSVLRAAKVGEKVLVRGKVDRIGRTLANMRVEALVDCPEGERLIGTATVVKSLIPAPY
ncbi:MAG: PaaI family thioesterase [Moraxellaceae bacterium]|nr:PaaI family thioesterase [Moraxellaceae bacterium]